MKTISTVVAVALSVAVITVMSGCDKVQSLKQELGLGSHEGEGGARPADKEMWNEYVSSVVDEKVSLRSQEAWKKFKGKKIALVGRYQNSGNAIGGGIFVSFDVNKRNVKLMIRASEKERVLNLKTGEKVTFTGRFDSIGDMMHCVTLADGVLSLEEGNENKLDAKDGVSGTSNNSEGGGARPQDKTLWKKYLSSVVDEEVTLRKQEAWKSINGQKISLVGRYQNSGKALMGGIYVTFDVDGRSVKLMIRKAEKDSVLKLNKGDLTTFTGKFSSQGDLMHCVTLSDGVLSLEE